MAVLSRIIHYPKFKYGQLTEGHTLVSTLPAGKELAYTPPINKDPHLYLMAGATAINVNEGVPYTNLVITPDQQAVCGGCNYLQGYSQANLGNKSLRDFTEAECRAAVRSHMSDPQQGKRIYTDQSGEAYGDQLRFRVDDGIPQKRWIEEEQSLVQAERNGSYHSQYRGHFFSRSFTEDFGNNELLRPGFTSNSEALRLGRMSTPDDFLWTGYQYRDGLISSYYTGNINPRKFLGGHLSDIVLERKARIELGATALSRKILSFAWFGEYQTIGDDVWHVTYKTATPDGGFTLHTRPPRYPLPVQMAISLYGFALLDGVFGWESTLMYGTDPSIISPDFMDIGNQGKYYGSGNPQQKQGVSYYRTDVTAGYAPHPLGYQDAPLVAVKWVQIAHNHSQWGNMLWCRAKRSSSSSYFSNDASYVLDRYQQDQPWVLCGGNGSKGWVLFSDYSGPYGQIRDWDIDTPLGQTSITHTSGSTRLYLLN